MPDVMIARQGARLVVDGTPVRLLANGTTAHADSQVVRDYPDLWKPLPVDFPAEAEQPELAAVAAAPQRPSVRDARATWDAYAVALGLNAEAVAELASKVDVIELVDAVEEGRARIGDDGTIEEI